MKIRLKKESTTHMPILIRAVLVSSGPVLELGAGINSTPLLHWLCAENRRPLVTYESDSEYFGFARKFLSRTHKIIHIDDWNKIDTASHWSVVLVDQNTNRDKTAILLKDSADYIILHDSEQEKLYGYDNVYPHFKYIYHWTFCKPYTTVVSNFKNLKNLRSPSEKEVKKAKKAKK